MIDWEQARFTPPEFRDKEHGVGKKLIDSVSKTLQISRHGEFAELHFKQTSVVVLSLDLFRKQQWASGRDSTGNPDGDRRRFLEQFETLVALHGSGIASRGSDQSIIKLLKAIKQAGIPVEQYAVDPRHMEMLYPKRALVQQLTPKAAETPPEMSRK
jgi:hypothetical protein